MSGECSKKRWGTKRGVTMNLRSNALSVAVAGFAAVAGMFAVSELAPRQSFAALQPAYAAQAVAEAAPAATFRIVPADVMARYASNGPVTGDSSN